MYDLEGDLLVKSIQTAGRDVTKHLVRSIRQNEPASFWSKEQSQKDLYHIAFPSSDDWPNDYRITFLG